MYHRILVPVENSSYDERILDHVRQLAQYCGASIVLIHVAGAPCGEHSRGRLSTEGLDAEALLATGDPSAEIAAAAERERCDLIAMSTHGHRFIADLIYGSVASAVRHMTNIPVLLLRAPSPAKQKAGT